MPQLHRRPTLSSRTSLEKILPPYNLDKEAKQSFFEHLFCQLASFRNEANLYGEVEVQLQFVDEGFDQDEADIMDRRNDGHAQAIDRWAREFSRKAWVVCCERDEEECPILDPYADTSTRDLPPLPPQDNVAQLLNAIIFLHLTTAEEKQYSALTRAFLCKFEYFGLIDEGAIAWTLKNPEKAVQEVEEKHEQDGLTTRIVDKIRAAHGERSEVMRAVGIGLGAVAGGVLVGVTGGLAAPLVGAGLMAAVGWIPIAGPVVGLIMSGLVGSSAVCGALFGIYGAKSTVEMVEKHTRAVKDLKVVPVCGAQGEDIEVGVEDTLAVRLCVSGWLNSIGDVEGPWKVFEGDDTYALQWEIEALMELSNALSVLLTSQAMEFATGEVLRRTMFATLMSSLAPLSLLKIGQIMDNPWMNARARATKVGAVLGELLAKRVFGNRPVTLVGYSLGSLVIYEALIHLASLPPSETVHLIQDAYLFGTPAGAESADWVKIRRVVAGRVINGYSDQDYVLAILSRLSSASWSVAGLVPVPVKGIENIRCEEVLGHTLWGSKIGECLQKCKAPGTRVIPQTGAPDEPGKSPRERSSVGLSASDMS